MSGKGVLSNKQYFGEIQQISAIIFYTVHSRGTNTLQARASRGPKSELHVQGRSIG